MSNQRPPPGGDGSGNGKRDGQTRPGAPASVWSDPNRTQPYTPRRRSIVDRLRAEAPDSGPAHPEGAETLPPGQASPNPADPARTRAAPPRGATRDSRARTIGAAASSTSPRRPRRLLPFAMLFAAVVVAGLAAGAGMAWIFGWRPDFFAAGDPPSKPPAEKQPETREATPGAPKAPPVRGPAPPGGEIAPACLSAVSEVKAGASACGFSLDPAGALSFAGKRLIDRLAAGTGTAQRIVLQPLAPSKRYAVFAACEATESGRCPAAHFVDIAAQKLHAIKAGGDEVLWVSWSPNELVAVIGYRDGPGHAIAVLATENGETLKASALPARRNRYALVKQGTIRWRKEEAFTVEVKFCNFGAGRQRNESCESSDTIKFRRRAVRLD